MITLEQALQPFHVPEKLPQGAPRGEKLRKEELRTALAAARDWNRRVFWITVALIVGLYVVAVVGVLFNLEREAVVVGINAGFGALVTWPVIRMIRLWREMSRMELLMALLQFQTPEALQVIVNELVK